MPYTYDEQILSDLHKDAHGFRPREYFWNIWESSNQDEKQVIWDGLLSDLDYELERERQAEEHAISKFERNLTEIQNIMCCDRNAAIRVYVDSLDLSEHVRGYGASYICYEAGIPYRMSQMFVDAGVATCID